ncbi:MAG: geranylgeranyl reductase family protein [Deltaproteobacteria bacterium]|nr:geranylgeranyl reductase family protein [Deltaproteobacteria bacterium]
MTHDAIVIGLGPAGSTACRTLALKGLKVAGIDKAIHPRYKSCGGCISPKIDGLLGFDASHLIERTIHGIAFTYKFGRRLDVVSDRPLGYNVMRGAFDHLLVEKAREAGSEIIEGCRVTGVSDDGGHVTVRTADGRGLEARFAIGADGASGFIGRERFGLNPRECAVSLTAEVPYGFAGAKEMTDRAHVDFGSIPFGYSWIFPKKDRLSIGIAVDSMRPGAGAKEHFRELVSRHPVLKGIDERAIKTDGWTVPVYYAGIKDMVRGRIAIAGDTGHLVDPFMGEGIYYAAASGMAAAEAVAEAAASGRTDLSQYQRWLEEDVFPELKAACRLSEIVYRHPRLWYSIIEKEPEIMRRFYGVLRGEEGLAPFYGWVMSRIKARPWNLLRHWVASRFRPA